MTQLNSICVYCGSSTGRSKEYERAAESLAAALVKRNIVLVYGGASIGIMGQVADHMLALGGQVIGVIPKALAHKEVAHPRLTELHITASMHDRKLRMTELSDGFIAMPGGIGTLEELFEIWTWAQLGLHGKPCGLLNVDGFYDSLLGFLNHVRAEEFVKPIHRDILLVEQDPDKLLDRFETYRAPPAPHWINTDQI